MATFGIILILFMLCGTKVVQGTVEPYSVCEGEDAKFKFDRVPDNNILVAGWFKMAGDNVNSTCILKKHIIARPCIPYVGRASLSPTDNRLTIARIDRSETGLYLQELKNVNNGENGYQSYLQVTVLVPPSGLPHINATKSSDGKLILTCFEPEFKGIPEVLTQFQDSNGKPQNGLVVTVSDSMYKCCLLGDAVRCMGQHDDVCSIYIVKDIEKVTCISCWILIYVSGVIPWFSLLVKPLCLRLKCICKKPKEPSRENGKGESIPLTNNGTSNETAGVNTNQTIRKCCKRKYEHMFKTIMMMLIANLAIVIILSVYFCWETDDCLRISLLVTFTGFGISFAIVAFLVIIKKLSAMKTEESSGARKTGTSDAERLSLTSSGGIPVSDNEDRTHVHGQDKRVPTQESSGAVTAPDAVDLQIMKKEVNDETNEAEPFQDDKEIVELRLNCNRVTRPVTN